MADERDDAPWNEPYATMEGWVIDTANGRKAVFENGNDADRAYRAHCERAALQQCAEALRALTDGGCASMECEMGDEFRAGRAALAALAEAEAGG